MYSLTEYFLIHELTSAGEQVRIDDHVFSLKTGEVLKIQAFNSR